jgi:GAF domain-containing protein
MRQYEQDTEIAQDSISWMLILVEVFDEVQRATSVQAAVQLLVRAGQRLGFARARLWLLHSDSQLMEGAGYVGEQEFEDFIGLRVAVTDSPYTQQILALREPCVYHGEQLSPWLLTCLLPNTLFEPPREDWVHLPLWAAERCWGVLTLDNAAKPCIIDSERQLVLRLFARQMATALNHVHLVEQEAREQLTHRWLRGLVTVTENLQQATTIEAVADVIVQSGALFGFARARLWLGSDDGTMMIAARQIGNLGLDQFIGFALSCAASPYVGCTLAAQTSLLFTGNELGQSLISQHFAQHGYLAPVGQWVSIPLLCDANQCLGLLTLDTCEAVPMLSSMHLEILNLLSRQAALALNRARQSYEHYWLQTLTDFEQAAQGSHSVQEMATIIVNFARKLKFARVRLWNYDAESNFLVGLHQIGDYCPYFASIWMPLSASSYGHAQPCERAPIFFSGNPEERAYLDFFFEEQGIAPPNGEWASVPLWIDNSFIGLLELDDAEYIRSLHPGQRMLLDLLGKQVATALEHALLHERGQRHNIEIISKNQELNWLTNIITITSAAQQALTFKEVADVVTQGGQALGFRRARLWLLHEDIEALECVSQVGHNAQLVGFSIPLSEAVYANEILNAPSLRLFSSRATQPAFLDLHASDLQFTPPSGSWVGIPLRGEGRTPIGMLVLDDASDQPTLSRIESDLLRMFGQHVEVALERARLYEAERHQRFEREWLHRLAESAAETQKAQTLPQLVISIIEGGCALGFDRVRLWRLEGDYLIGDICSGNHGNFDFEGLRLPLTDIPYGHRLLTERTAFLCFEAQHPQSFHERLRGAGVAPPHAWLEIPLYDGAQRPWGVLTLDSPRDERLLHDDQRPLIMLFQRQLNAALQRTRLYAHRTKMLDQSQKIGASLYEHDNTSEQQMLHRIVAAALEALEADIVTLYLYDADEHRFLDPIIKPEPYGSTPITNPSDNQNNIVHFIAKRQRPHFSKYAQRDRYLVGDGLSKHRTFTMRQNIQSFAGLPLAAFGHLLGILCVNYRTSQDFNTYDRITIQSFAYQATMVIASMQLTRIQEREKVQLARIQERERIYGDMHDTLQSGLVALRNRSKMAIEAFKNSDHARTQDLLHKIRRQSWNIYTDLQIILLDREWIEGSGTIEQIIHKRLDHLAATDCVVDIHSAPQLPALSVKLIRRILYIVAEAAVNAVERGQAQHVLIHLRYARGRLLLKIADNGKGFDRFGIMPQRGRGINNMCARAAEIHGTLRIRTTIGYGTTLRFELPLPPTNKYQLRPHLRRCAVPAIMRLQHHRRVFCHCSGKPMLKRKDT